MGKGRSQGSLRIKVGSDMEYMEVGRMSLKEDRELIVGGGVALERVVILPEDIFQNEDGW